MPYDNIRGMRHNILPHVLSSIAILTAPLYAQEGSQAASQPAPKAVVDVLLAINTYHMNEVFQSPEKLQAQAEAEIRQLIQNSRLGEYAEFRIVGVYCYSVPETTLRDIGMADSLRNQYKADLVLDLGVLNQYGTAGQAYTVGMYGEFVGGITPNPQEDAYLAEVDVIETNHVNTKCSFTIAHELAHLLGGGHCATQNTQPWCGLYPFAAGAVDKQHGAVTLLSYEDRREHNMRGGLFRNLCVLSSPDTFEKDGVTYTIGHAQADNRRCFLMSLPMVAGYREGSATAVLNDSPSRAFEIPPLYTTAYYAARFKECATYNANFLITLISCMEHVPHMFCCNHFTRLWGSTANATHDTTPGTAPNVWYRITVPHTATYTAGFRTNAGPLHHCRIYRKEGNEIVELAVTPAAPSEYVHGALSFCATQGDELYIEICPEQASGVFNFYLGSDAAVPALPDFPDDFKAAAWENEHGLSALEYAVLNPDPTDLKKLLQWCEDDLKEDSQSIELLAVAALMGHTEHCRLLLAAGVTADTESSLGAPLAMAIIAGQEETAAILREAGADIDWTDAEKHGALLYNLCNNSCYRGIMKLVDAGVSADSPVGYSVRIVKTPTKYKEKDEAAPREMRLLHFAAESGNTEAVRYLLSKGATVDALTPRGETALTLAARKGHTECVKLLLAAGASPNSTEKDTTAPLAAAAAQGHAECIKLLLDAGATTAADAHKEKTPLMLAIEIGNTACIELLLPATEDLTAATARGNTTLMAAATLATPDLLRMLLEKGADANARALSGRTALLMAAQHSRIENMRLLIAHGADVNAQDNDGNTPLLMTTLRGNTESTILLLENGADATLANKNKCTPLMQAASNGNAACVKILLEHGAKDSYTRRQRTTSLMLAAAKGSAECIRLLLDAGSKVNARDDNRMSPLCFAAQYGNAECLQLLIDAGAKVQVRNAEGDTPLMLAAAQGHTECVRLLLANGALADEANNNAVSALMQATAGGHTECVKLLLEHGAPPNAADPGGGTALSRAVENDHADCVKLLLAHGADPTQKQKNGNSLLHVAVNSTATQCLVLLCNANTPINATNDEGDTALTLAAAGGHKEAVSILLQHGADVNIIAKDSDSPATYYAISQESKDILEMLIQAGADVNYRFSNGTTLLHVAAQQSNIEILEYLVAQGLDVEATALNGDTPLQYAVGQGAFYNVKWLLSKGANPHTVNQAGENLFLTAVGTGNVKLLKFLVALGVDPHHVDKQNSTALHVAAAFTYSEETVTYLLQMGFDPNAATTEGTTPIMLANNSRIFDTLLKHGANLHARDIKGRTALHYAAIEERPGVYSDMIKAGADPAAKDNDGMTPYDLAKQEQKKREEKMYADQENAPSMRSIIRRKKF